MGTKIRKRILEKRMKEKNKIGFISLIAKHFLQEIGFVMKDSGAILILIIAMLVYPVVYSLGYLNEVVTGLPMAVVDLDRTNQSRNYIQMIDATPELDITHEVNNLIEGERLFMNNKVSGVILIDSDFEKNIISKKGAAVSIYADASYFLNYRNQFMAVNMVNSTYNAKIKIARYMAEGQSLRKAKVSQEPLNIQTHILYNPAAGYGTFVMPGMILIIIQQTLLLGIGIIGGSFSETKKSPFFLETRKRRREIIPHLLGKSGAYIIISIFNILFALILTHHWFEYPDNTSFVNIMILMMPFLIATIFSAITIATLFKHRESAIIFMVFLSPIAMFLSGISWPMTAVPEWLEALSKLMPSSITVPAYLRLRIMGVSIMDIKPELIASYIQAGIYVAITVVYFFIKDARSRKKYIASESE